MSSCCHCVLLSALAGCAQISCWEYWSQTLICLLLCTAQSLPPHLQTQGRAPCWGPRLTPLGLSDHPLPGCGELEVPAPPCGPCVVSPARPPPGRPPQYKPRSPCRSLRANRRESQVTEQQSGDVPGHCSWRSPASQSPREPWKEAGPRDAQPRQPSLNAQPPAGRWVSLLRPPSVNKPKRQH